MNAVPKTVMALALVLVLAGCATSMSDWVRNAPDDQLNIDNTFARRVFITADVDVLPALFGRWEFELSDESKSFVEQSIVAILRRDWLRAHPDRKRIGTGRPGIDALTSWWAAEGQMVLQREPYTLPPGLEFLPDDLFERWVPIDPETLKRLKELGYIETDDDG